ncbi:MAG: hypothetical protein OXH22_08815 [Chloroflexi bacterium]|nr:hypothetical protein [Chloroflexota bacterium]
MRSYTLPDFWDAYRRLPASVKRQAREAYSFFELNPRHPSLDFKSVGRRSSSVYSVRVNIDYRALGAIDDGNIVWFWIGPHHEYDRLLRQV